MKFFSIPDLPSTSRGCSSKLPVTNNMEGWIGHALDPLGVLYDTLTEASISHDNNTTRTTGMFILKIINVLIKIVFGVIPC
jgi:hypothetical protein